MEHTGQRPLDTLTLLLYTGAGTSSSFTLYEDDGITLEYERGASASTIFAQQWSPAKRTLRVSIGAVRGSYTGKPARRTYRVEVHGITGSPVAVRVNGTPLHSTSGSSPQPSWFPIAGGGPVIFVQVGADSTSDMEIQY
jgi:alpha-glucosidase (family GH31 glycosyl hydrolase)